jgi:hypothetical protein
MVDDPQDIAGAAFTVNFNTDALDLIDVESLFFDTFVNQQFTLGENGLGTDGYVTVGGQPFEAPIVFNQILGGARLAGALHTGATIDSSVKTLFTLSFQLKDGASLTDYPITIEPTVINNPAAGYDTDTELDLIIKATVVTEDPLDMSFEPLLTATDYNASPAEAGTVSFETGGSQVTVDVAFNAGLNLFSFPISVPDAYNTTIKFMEHPDFGESVVSKIQGYDGNWQTNSWQTVWGQTTVTGNEVSIGNGQGFLVYMKVPKTVSFTGTLISSPVNLNIGLNVVGFQNPPQGLTAFDLLDQLQGKITKIQRYTDNWETASWQTVWGQTTKTGADFEIENGKAYMVYMDTTVAGFVPSAP